MTDTNALLSRIEKLEAEVRALRDKDEITRIQYIYGYYIDNRMWDEMIALFTDNEPTFEIGRRGHYVGKDSIRRFLFDSMGEKRWGLEKNEIANHFQLQPVITLGEDGKSAKCRARSFIQMSHLPHMDRLRWAEGIYENTFVKEADGWKLKSLWWAATFYAFIQTMGEFWFDSVPHDDGHPAEQPSRPIDEKLGRTWVRFHYPHPFTGEEVPSPSAKQDEWES